MNNRYYVIRLRDRRVEGQREFRNNLKDFVALRNDEKLPQFTPVYNAAASLLLHGESGPLNHTDWCRAYRTLSDLVPGDENPIHFFHSQYV